MSSNVYVLIFRLFFWHFPFPKYSLLNGSCCYEAFSMPANLILSSQRYSEHGKCRISLPLRKCSFTWLACHHRDRPEQKAPDCWLSALSGQRSFFPSAIPSSFTAQNPTSAAVETKILVYFTVQFWYPDECFVHLQRHNLCKNAKWQLKT